MQLSKYRSYGFLDQVHADWSIPPLHVPSLLVSLRIGNLPHAIVARLHVRQEDGAILPLDRGFPVDMQNGRTTPLERIHKRCSVLSVALHVGAISFLSRNKVWTMGLRMFRVKAIPASIIIPWWAPNRWCLLVRSSNGSILSNQINFIRPMSSKDYTKRPSEVVCKKVMW